MRETRLLLLPMLLDAERNHQEAYSLPFDKEIQRPVTTSAILIVL